MGKLSPGDQPTDEFDAVADNPFDRQYVYRFNRYLAYGFSEASAAVLAAARHANGFFVDHAQAKRLLDRGATHDQVVAILT